MPNITDIRAEMFSWVEQECEKHGIDPNDLPFDFSPPENEAGWKELGRMIKKANEIGNARGKEFLRLLKPHVSSEFFDAIQDAIQKGEG